MARPRSPRARSRPIGCLCSGVCSCWSRSSCRAALSALCSTIGASGASAVMSGLPNARPNPRPSRRSESMDARIPSALLYLDAVTVSFDGFRALNDLSFTIEPGEMRAIIGPNGAGKTTMMDVVTGKTRPDKGDVYFDGAHDLTKLDETQIAELGIGRKFQKPTVFDMHTVEDNLRLALKGDRKAFDT